MAIALRSGRELEERKNGKKNTEKEKYADIGEHFKQHSSKTTEEEEAAKMQLDQQVEKENPRKKKEVKAYELQVPFPQRLQKVRLEEQFSRFLDMFKKIEINIPFSEALTQIPLYVKFMKEILSRKRKIAKEEIVSLTATCSAVIQNSLSEKMQDPGSFTIPCEIGHADVGKALCDSGANINLMPLSIPKRLSLGELTPTVMTLQMEDRTLAHSEGILEDVLIKVGKFIFLVDFVVIDIKEDKQVPLLLGRPFLATGAALIDVKKGELTLRVGDEVVHFNLNHSLKQPKLSDVECEIVEMKIPNCFEMMKDFNFQHSMNENEKNFQYLEHLEIEFLDPNVKLNMAVLSVEENNVEKSSSYKAEGAKENTSS